jgi:hypothetical protein
METFDITKVSHVSLYAQIGTGLGFLIFILRINWSQTVAEGLLSLDLGPHHFSFILRFNRSRSSGVMLSHRFFQ